MMQRTLCNGMVILSQAALWAACALAVLGLAWRTTVPGRGVILLLALFVSGLVFLSRYFDRFSGVQRRQLFFVLPAVLFGLFFVLPSPWTAVFLVVLGLTELAWRKFPTTAGMEPPCSFSGRRNDGDLFDGEEESEEEFDEGITQQIVRRRTEEGKDRFEGTFLVEFAADQRTASVHVPFCPTFSGTPTIQTMLLDGDEATFTVLKPQPFGVRIDVKRQGKAAGTSRILVVAEK